MYDIDLCRGFRARALRLKQPAVHLVALDAGSIADHGAWSIKALTPLPAESAPLMIQKLLPQSELHETRPPSSRTEPCLVPKVYRAWAHRHQDASFPAASAFSYSVNAAAMAAMYRIGPRSPFRMRDLLAMKGPGQN